MTKPAKKPNSGAPGVKLLLTAASLAATLGGWAVLSGQQGKPAPAPAPEQAVAPVVTVRLAPLPTLVPLATPQPRLAAINQSRPGAVAAAPQPAAANTIVLRDVSAPQVESGRSAGAPAPVANTRSSR